ncbi:hypothetical protein MELB17_00320 [Marinobacter sp. ELB17]|nr:hypothetical protein MELB17_00320 [Marinobacter sp. ELB17]
MDERSNQLCHLKNRDIELPDGSIKKSPSTKWQTAAQRFYEKDLYSTFFGENLNDEIEQRLFGPIDDSGSKAIRAFLTNDQSQWHRSFQDLFIYLDAQKLRSPKGLDWIKSKYPELSQLQLMMEMQSLRSIHCTLWVEGVRELVSADDSDVKFIVSDHPVTVYNYACPPESELCKYPNDPDISLKGSQTIFPLDKNRCLILTNLEFAQDPDNANPLEQRTNATRFHQSMVKTIEFINTRRLTADEVTQINHVIKSRAQSSIAAGKEEWLYPEKNVTYDWSHIQQVLLPPAEELYRFGGEIYAGSEDGSVHYQDAFGRTTPQNEFLSKNTDENKIGRNNHCGCGSAKKYKNCCRNVPVNLRATWNVLSIRERNLAFCNCIRSVLRLDSGKTWVDVRRELSEEQISKIYGFYSVLWPRQTDIYSLLSKPDGKFRGLYTGPLDVRIIRTHALPMASVFDEFLIEMPITNPNNVRPEFSPTESPGSYKYQALKDFLFMLEIEPFIERGLVNLIPDPSEFDLDLMGAFMEMARARGKSEDIVCEEDRQLAFGLMTEDILNSTAMMPTEVKIQMLIDQFGLSNLEATGMVSELESNAEASPLMILQSVGTVKSGQFIQYRLAPNYEMSLFVAQVTGSVLVTDSGSRWRQLRGAQHRKQGIVSYPWNTVLDQLTLIPIDYQFLNTLQKSRSHFASFRHLLKTIDNMVLTNDRDFEKLTQLSGQTKDVNDQIEGLGDHLAKNSLKIWSPDGGFHDAQVQRLLARSSCPRYDHQVRSVYVIGLSI